VLLVTDRGESSNKINLADVELRFARSDVRLFAAIDVTGEGPNASPEYLRALAQPLEKMVEAVGGEVFWFAGKPPVVRVDPDHNNLSGGPNGIIEKMSTGYRLQVAAPATQTKPVDLKLEIVGTSGEKNTGIALRYQPKLYPCSVTTTQK